MLPIALSVLCLLFSFSSQAQQVLTVQEALNQALNNNLQVKQALLQAALSEEDVKQAKMNFFPTLNAGRSEEHTSELQSLMRISYAVFCLKKKRLIKNKTMI